MRIPRSRHTSLARSRRLPAPLALALALSLLLLAACGSTSATTNSTPATHATATPAASVIYVALGASDALGDGATNPTTDGYVPLLIARMRAAVPSGYQALNLGISGIKLHDALANELPDALTAHPTIVTVWLVGNDFRGCVSLKQYGADLDTLLGQLHDKTKATVFVANTPDMSLLPYFKQGAPGAGACLAGTSTAKVHAMAQTWNATINPIIAKHGDVLVDLFSSDLASHPEYISTADGFHPSSAGYARLAAIFWAAITAHHAVPGV